jgi:serine phosphatase RsbU (regulator of sigma subunit)
MLQVRSDRRYDPTDLDLLQDLAGRAAMALDNARLYAERTHVARTLQESLLPPELPMIPGAAVSAAYLPSGEGNEVGGDFYDVFRAGEGWMLIVGDVCGKGAEAAALTALIRNSVRTLSMTEHDPVRVLDQVNEVMLREELDSRFATAILARMTLEDGGARVEVVTAGHPSPLVVRAAGAPDQAGGKGALLGALENTEFAPAEVRLARGDTLVLYTDGVLEAGAPERVLAPEELQALLADCAGADTRAVVQRLEREALESSGGALRDDVAILAVTVNRG